MSIATVPDSTFNNFIPLDIKDHTNICRNCLHLTISFPLDIND